MIIMLEVRFISSDSGPPGFWRASGIHESTELISDWMILGIVVDITLFSQCFGSFTVD